jgi:ribosome biogenesis GTPase / thiamine phosphate phosphatase
MGGRRSHNEKNSARKAQGSKQVRGFARGHGAHHRHKAGRDAPRLIGSGRDRTHEIQRQREFGRLDDDQLMDLEGGASHAPSGRSVEELGDAQRFGAAMDGERASGTVVEVRKGNFLTLMKDDSKSNASNANGMKIWKRDDILRTFVRGTMQQFDTGLSSLVAAGDEIDVVVPPMTDDKSLFKSELHAVLTRVSRRRSEFRRLHPSGRSIQTLAANVDQVVVVASTAQPDFRPGFVDRVLVCAAACGLPALLVVNKMDLGLIDDDAELLSVYAALGVRVFKVSVADTGAPAGEFDALKSELAGKRTTLTGHSGVGKSSILRALHPVFDPDVIRTGEVSTQTQKGTHTTTHARLFRVELSAGVYGEVIDTPGVREFTPADTDRRNLWGWFPEIAALQGQCAYSDCDHTQEKGCAVLAAVESGAIHARRHQSYVRIYQTLPM